MVQASQQFFHCNEENDEDPYLKISIAGSCCTAWPLGQGSVEILGHDQGVRELGEQLMVIGGQLVQQNYSLLPPGYGQDAQIASPG